ncbi:MULTISPECIES: PAS domain-containing protein [unclassified Paracoccus (in: a-proteobacteria)]|uniref:PAS domain-containing protein n=1 Tax=unclassified Paracoccus (in: a-proteobacteria) TaxID=2688777 RepID=UPI0016004DCA|nr:MULTISPECIES: PAS domain-containing protein [unclassified Paracoccus (in: a-proteobacteria)]MBB1491991.1 PAS domain-containing protein [Paracoccus sp. MC1854]MBB1498146.1 PAS domain-containing protein [Paracoccus sp. MC1862]QQO45646.1 PAS domain-containing protein [Paracoccus sp. MC1862]
MVESNDSNGIDEALDRVLRMADFGPRQPSRILAELRAYWASLRHGRAVPSRADVTPQGLGGALEYAFILERVGPGGARFRLAGRHLVDLMGMEVRGMPLCALMHPGSRGRLSDVLEAVLQGPQIAEIELASPGSYGAPELTGRMLLLPLRSDLGDVTRVLGCLASEGEIGTAPRRFDLMAERADPVIEGGRLLPPSPSAAGFAEPGASWTPAEPRVHIHEDDTPEERRLRFRVISND